MFRKNKFSKNYILLVCVFLISCNQKVTKKEVSRKSSTYAEITDSKLTVSTILLADEKQVITLPEEENLIKAVISQLSLNIETVKQDLIVTKIQPHKPEETIVVIPEIVEETDDYEEFNSHICTSK